ncbi:MAG: hypothetical protein ACP5O7_03635 [Phycisphaerae bacterium]
MASTGCIDLSGQPNDPVMRTVRIGVEHHYEYEGHLYAMRGFLGIFSTGMDTLTQNLDAAHIVDSAAVADEARYSLRSFLEFEYKAGRLQGPLILVGHSWGADDQIRIARALGRRGIKVALLLLCDPVTPPLIPPNVERCIVIYKSHPLTDWFPMWRGVSAEAQDPTVTRLTNINLATANVGFNTSGINHVSISASPGVQNMMVNDIMHALQRAHAFNIAGPYSKPTMPPLQSVDTALTSVTSKPKG